MAVSVSLEIIDTVKGWPKNFKSSAADLWEAPCGSPWGFEDTAKEHMRKCEKCILTAFKITKIPVMAGAIGSKSGKYTYKSVCGYHGAALLSVSIKHTLDCKHCKAKLSPPETDAELTVKKWPYENPVGWWETPCGLEQASKDAAIQHIANCSTCKIELGESEWPKESFIDGEGAPPWWKTPCGTGYQSKIQSEGHMADCLECQKVLKPLSEWPKFIEGDELWVVPCDVGYLEKEHADQHLATCKKCKKVLSQEVKGQVTKIDFYDTTGPHIEAELPKKWPEFSVTPGKPSTFTMPDELWVLLNCLSRQEARALHKWCVKTFAPMSEIESLLQSIATAKEKK